jgi:pyruvate dehydrogenase E1 component alpha subunit
MLTFSYRGHEGLPAQPGRAEKRRDETDPVAKSRARILADGLASESQLKAVEKDVRETVNAAALFAKGAERPAPDALQSGVYA